MVMPAPEGPLSCSEHLMGQALLQSEEFLRFTGDSPETPAVDRIHFEMITRPNPDLDYFTVENLTTTRPFVCIWPFDLSGVRIASQAIQFNGSLQVHFEYTWDEAFADDPNLDETKEAEILRWWKNRIGLILQQAFQNSHDTIMNIRRIGQLNWWTRNPLKPSDQHLGFNCVVEWGPDEN